MIKKRQTKHVRSYLETGMLRRKRRRKRMFARILFSLLVVGIFTGIAFLLRIKALQVDAIEITGTEQVQASELQALAMREIEGTRHVFGIVPSTNTLFVDEQAIEAAVVRDFPAIESVSVHTGLGGTVRMAITERHAVGLWCDMSGDSCYQMDDTGLLFMKSIVASSTGEIGTGMAHAVAETTNLPVFKGILTETNPSQIGKRFLSAKEIQVFANARTMLEAAGQDIDHVRCDSDTACAIKIEENGILRINPHDDLENAFDRLGSALKSPVFAGEKFEYVDLRYGNKLFYKLVGGSSVNHDASSTPPVQAKADVVERR